MSAKTPMQSAVEGALSGLFGSFVSAAQEKSPPPPLSDDGEPITAMSIHDQLGRSLKLDNGTTDRERAIRQALSLACYLARQEGWTEKDGLLAATLAWQQTANLTAAPIRG
jgi:hypothetical protein